METGENENERRRTAKDYGKMKLKGENVVIAKTNKRNGEYRMRGKREKTNRGTE